LWIEHELGTSVTCGRAAGIFAILMRYYRFLRCFVFCLLAAISIVANGQPVKEPKTKSEWSADCQPFRIVGNVYYVGTQDLACYFISTNSGHILINTGLTGSDKLILQHVKALGFNSRDIKILLTQQAHYDHVGGMAAIKKQTGAKLWADASDADVLKSGGATDYEMGKYGVTFQPVQPDSLLKDGAVISLGGMKLQLLHHPGHTKGSCSYLFTVKNGTKNYRVLIANMPSIIVDGSLDSVTAYPTIAKDYAYTFKAMKGLQFDIWLAAHASQFNMHAKHKPGSAYNPEAFVDPKGYAAALDDLQKAYNEKMKQ
jgi:metallo-beta-lactamase class B